MIKFIKYPLFYQYNNEFKNPLEPDYWEVYDSDNKIISIEFSEEAAAKMVNDGNIIKIIN